MDTPAPSLPEFHTHTAEARYRVRNGLPITRGLIQRVLTEGTDALTVASMLVTNIPSENPNGL